MKIVEIDYSEFSLEQLQALLMFLDKNKYPEREEEIIKQITIKQNGGFVSNRPKQCGS